MKVRRPMLYRDCVSNPAFLSYVLDIARALEGCRTLLDVGCGYNSPLKYLEFDRSVGVDGWQPALEKAQTRHTHNEFVHGDLRDIGNRFSAKSFDGVVGLDIIEHFEKEQALRLLENMEDIAAHVCLISTPNGFLPQQTEIEGNILQAHLSGWEPLEFRARGYRVTGLYGWKSLRGELQNLKYRPRLFWGLVSFFSHLVYTRAHPERAAALLCVKRF